MAEHNYPERTVAPPPGHHITVGLRVPLWCGLGLLRSELT
jgi:hypothetical protein